MYSTPFEFCPHKSAISKNIIRYRVVRNWGYIEQYFDHNGLLIDSRDLCTHVGVPTYKPTVTFTRCCITQYSLIFDITKSLFVPDTKCHWSRPVRGFFFFFNFSSYDINTCNGLILPLLELKLLKKQEEKSLNILYLEFIMS